jgi:L-seryl-tRNA(Ser) seleniumtransferase
LDGTWRDSVPTLKLLTLSQDELLAQAQALAAAVSKRLGDLASVSVVPSEGQVGGGSLPETVLASYAVCVSPKKGRLNRTEAALRGGEPPVICRLDDSGLRFDVRTVLPEQHAALVDRLAGILSP